MIIYSINGVKLCLIYNFRLSFLKKGDTIFDYITDMQKYTALFPKGIHFTLLSSATKMKKGVEYEFQLKRFGFSRNWVTRINAYKKGEYFVEVEQSVLFDNWRHECRLEEHGEKKTLMVDHIEYAVGFGLIGKLVDDLWLRRDLRQIYEHIHQRLLISV